MFNLTSSGRNALLSPEYHRLNFEPMIEKITVGKGASRRGPSVVVGSCCGRCR